MIVVRPIAKRDLLAFTHFSFESILGFTHLPNNKKKLEEVFLKSKESFSKNILKPGSEVYYFVLEDLEVGVIAAICGILAVSSLSRKYFYHVTSVCSTSEFPFVNKEMNILKLASPFKNASEVCSLYLHPNYRHSGNGRLLSLSRFLFMAAFQKRFKNNIIAEMRGYIDDEKCSPFYSAVGQHFSGLSYIELMEKLDADCNLAVELLPKFPLYTSLLPIKAQEVIGKTHTDTLPALHLLTHEGFEFSQFVDIFDGGPIVIAKKNQIRTIKNSKTISIRVTDENFSLEEDKLILSNDRLDFRALCGHLKIENKRGIIHKDVAQALLIREGDFIRYNSIH